MIERWLTTQPWQEQIKRYRTLYQQKAELMLETLQNEMPPEVAWTRPRGGFFVWLTVPTGVDTSALLAKAIGRRVAYVPGRGFYDDGSGGDHLRLCFSFPPLDRIREGVSRLAELLHDELGLLRAVYGAGAPELAGRRNGQGLA
jgi:DNA-binding transcriptional MocR family regulator